MPKINSICVYCGSQSGNDANYMKMASEVGKTLAESGVKLVYGGGNSGIMGAVSRSVLDHGGNVVGIIPTFLVQQEGVHGDEFSNYDVIVTKTMHERKQLMFEHSDAFLTLPGGIGTLEEAIEIMTWAQLGQHHKPIGFLNAQSFWQPMFELLSHMREAGFIHTSDRVQPLIIDAPEAIMPAFSEAVVEQLSQRE